MCDCVLIGPADRPALALGLAARGALGGAGAHAKGFRAGQVAERCCAAAPGLLAGGGLARVDVLSAPGPTLYLTVFVSSAVVLHCGKTEGAARGLQPAACSLHSRPMAHGPRGALYTRMDSRFPFAARPSRPEPTALRWPQAWRSACPACYPVAR